MLNRSYTRALMFSLLALAFVGAGCHKKVTPPPPAPAPAPTPPPARPTVTLQASSTSIQQGQSATLTWSSTNATSLTLSPSVGTVAPEGTTSVTPNDTTTYTITATGPGGSADSSVTINVAAPPPPPAPAPPPQPSLQDLFNRDVRDAYFDFDKADIRADAKDALAQTATFLKAHPEAKVIVEGHCDERGSTEYNLALGDRRANAAKNYLVSLGVPADQLDTISYGKERPFCSVSNEECWQQNRRAHFVLKQ